MIHDRLNYKAEKIWDTLRNKKKKTKSDHRTVSQDSTSFFFRNKGKKNKQKKKLHFKNKILLLVFLV